MPLEVRGAAIMDPTGRAVRFAGCPIGSREGSITVCEVTADVLRYLGNDAEAQQDKLLGIFAANQDDIFKIASQQFDEGMHRPRVTMADFPSA